MLKLTRRDLLMGLGGAAATLGISKSLSSLTKEEYEVGKYGPIELIALEAEQKNHGLFNPSLSEDGSTLCYFESNPNWTVKFGDYVRYDYDQSQLQVLESPGRKKKFVLNPPFGWSWDSRVTPALTDRHLAVALFQYSAKPRQIQGAVEIAAALNDIRDGIGGIGIYDIVTGRMQRVIPLKERQRVTTLKSSKDHLVAAIDVPAIEDGKPTMLEGRVYNFFQSVNPQIFSNRLDNYKNNNGDVIDVSQGYVVFTYCQLRTPGEITKDVFVYDIARTTSYQLTNNSPQHFIANGPEDVKISRGRVLYLNIPEQEGPALPQYIAHRIREDGVINLDQENVVARWLSQGHNFYESVDLTLDGDAFVINHWAKEVELMNSNGHHPLKIPLSKCDYTPLVAADEEVRAVFSTRASQDDQKDKAFVVQYRRS